MKTERTKIHFLSDVLVAVASLDLKVPNNSVRGPGKILDEVEQNILICQWRADQLFAKAEGRGK